MTLRCRISSRFAVDRAGLWAVTAPHAGNYDISYARCLPNMVIMTPSNEDEARQMLYGIYHRRSNHGSLSARKRPRCAG